MLMRIKQYYAKRNEAGKRDTESVENYCEAQKKEPKRYQTIKPNGAQDNPYQRRSHSSMRPGQVRK